MSVQALARPAPRDGGSSTDPAEALAAFIIRHAPLFVLTGAGVSTGSGIPDYRDQEGRWKGAEPIRYQPFLRDPEARRRYWARSFSGWPRVAAAAPNGLPPVCCRAAANNCRRSASAVWASRMWNRTVCPTRT
mgnify:CR=1 FL=1